MNHSVLIIGAQGYLGSRLYEYLTDKDFDVTGFDIGFFKYGVLSIPRDYNTTQIDAREIEEKHLKGFDSVILLAGISNDPFNGFDPKDVYNPTRSYTSKIAKLCKKLSIKFIFPSSCSIYGIAQGIVNETNEPNPQTHYSKNKLEIEEDLKEISDKEFTPFALRLATVFGPSPRIRFDVVVNMLCGMAVANKNIILNSNGMAWRPHVHIDDVCTIFEACLLDNSKREGLTIVNVGMNENNTRVIDIANFIKKEIPDCEISFLNKESNVNELFKDRKIQDGVDVRTYKVDFSYLKKVFPESKLKWDMQKGIKDLIYFLNNYLLDDKKFIQRDFYRLQQLEFLLKTNQLDKDLIWHR